MTDYTNKDQERQTDMPRVLSKEEKRKFSGMTFDEQGREENPRTEFQTFFKHNFRSVNPFVAIGGVVLLGIFVIMFGGFFLVMAIVASVITFLASLLK